MSNKNSLIYKILKKCINKATLIDENDNVLKLKRINSNLFCYEILEKNNTIYGKIFYDDLHTILNGYTYAYVDNIPYNIKENGYDPI